MKPLQKQSSPAPATLATFGALLARYKGRVYEIHWLAQLTQPPSQSSQSGVERPTRGTL